mmetsp:Transcript_1218/g.2338  ORF Transcript_1218/g.2338 Transcript_1218/m.2338 type:complete len:207 (-) Transcript_1218:314-934(-)
MYMNPGIPVPDLQNCGNIKRTRRLERIRSCLVGFTTEVRAVSLGLQVLFGIEVQVNLNLPGDLAGTVGKERGWWLQCSSDLAENRGERTPFTLDLTGVERPGRTMLRAHDGSVGCNFASVEGSAQMRTNIRDREDVAIEVSDNQDIKAGTLAGLEFDEDVRLLARCQSGTRDNIVPSVVTADRKSRGRETLWSSRDSGCQGVAFEK